MHSGAPPGWRRHFLYRTESLKTTWKLRLAVLAAVILTVWVTRNLWTPGVGWSLVCREEIAPSDAILVENFDPNYLLFERAAALEQAGLAARVIVPTDASDQPPVPKAVAREISELMARSARVRNVSIVPVTEQEPISLNAAYQIRDVLRQAGLRSVIVVAPAFRSRRSALVYRAVLPPAGIRVYCVPVFGQHTPQDWTATWHGIQEVAGQFVKLQYYRFYVLPRARLASP